MPKAVLLEEKRTEHVLVLPAILLMKGGVKINYKNTINNRHCV
jgi:hypothetical protein